VSLSGSGFWGRCTKGGECGPPILPPCCPGFVCVFEGMRSFCL
jgi:hypothetical protein